MALIDLPTELLLGVWEYLEEEYDMNRFVRSCRRFYSSFNNHLYRHNVCFSGQAIPWAAEHGRHDTLQKLLDQGAGQIIEYDEWPLFTAAEHGQEVIVQMLLKAGNTPDMKDDRGVTALFHAAKGGHTAIIKLLLDRGADINVLDHNDQSPLRWAARYNHPDAVTVLLENGALPDRVEDDYTQLIYAAKSGNHEIVKILLSWTKAIDAQDPRYQQTALMWAAENSNKKAFDVLLKAGANIHITDNGGLTALSFAVKAGHKRIAASLLQNGADPEVPASGDQSCLAKAVQEGSLKAVKLLLQKGAAPDKKGDRMKRTPLSWAAEYNEHIVLRYLLETQQVDTEARDRDGMTPLSWAAREGCFKTVITLLEHGASPHTTDDDGLTPLAWAVKRHQCRVARHLMQHCGADPNTVDRHHKTPLYHAVNQQAVSLVRALLKGGADPTISDRNGRTPLSLAAEHGYTKIALMLLDDCTPRGTWSSRYHPMPDETECPCPSGRFIRAGRGRGIDNPDRFGRTPLFFATLHAHEDIVRALLSRGSAAIEAPTAAGRTPLSVAREHKDAAIDAKRFYTLQYIWQWFQYPCEANVDASRIAQAARLPVEPDEDDYPWCDNCDVRFFPYDSMFHCDCNGDNYDLCAECLGDGIKCLDETHVPEKRPIGWRT